MPPHWDFRPVPVRQLRLYSREPCNIISKPASRAQARPLPQSRTDNESIASHHSIKQSFRKSDYVLSSIAVPSILGKKIVLNKHNWNRLMDSDDFEQIV